MSCVLAPQSREGRSISSLLFKAGMDRCREERRSAWDAREGLACEAPAWGRRQPRGLDTVLHAHIGAQVVAGLWRDGGAPVPQ